MPVSFLVPAFLAGLALIAVPVILHLVQRPKDRVVEFPSLMFLDAVPYRSATRRRLRHPLLLLLRCLAFAAIVAAFARPALDRPAAAIAELVGGREVLILVDRSYSMGYGDRAAQAVAAARDVVNGLGDGDRATLVFFDDGAAAANRATAERRPLMAALDTFGVGAGRTRYAPALELAASVLASSNRPRGEVVLISDFQRAGWSGEANVRLPAGTAFTPVAVAEDTAANTFVASVSFSRDHFSGRERVSVAARVVRRGHTPVEGVPVTLELDGRPVQTQRIDVAANGAATAAFAPVTLAAPNTRGTVRLRADALPRDDAFHFALSPDAGVSVLILERSGSGPGPSLYLTQALAIGEAPAFRVETAKVERMTAADLAGRDVVILNAAPFPTGTAGQRLQAWVEQGGGLILVLGGVGGGTDVPEAILPGGAGRVVERERGQSAALGSLDYDHPVFTPFRQPGSGDFTPARFLRYRRVSGSEPDGVLARFDDGAVALMERAAGRGRVLTWTSTLDGSWNDLALQPVFLPFVHQLVKRAADYGLPPGWLTVGELLDLRGELGRAEAGAAGAGGGGSGSTGGAQTADTAEAEAGSAASAAVLLAPSGARIALERGEGLIRVQEPGFYELRNPAAPRARSRTFAVNLDIAESDLTPLEPAEITAAVVPPAGDNGTAPGVATAGATSAGAADPLDAEAPERRQVLWWFLLAGAAALLVGETALSNRLTGRGGARMRRKADGHG